MEINGPWVESRPRGRSSNEGPEEGVGVGAAQKGASSPGLEAGQGGAEPLGRYLNLGGVRGRSKLRVSPSPCLVARMSAVALLLPLLLPALCSARPSAGRDPEQLLPLFSQSKHAASEAQFLRVAQTAVQYLNYKQGSPSLLRKVVHVGKASVGNIPGVGHNYSLRFNTKHIQTGQNLGKCSANVLYPRTSKPVIEIKCTENKDANQIRKDDFNLYTKLKATSSSSDELKYFANIGSSYIAWKQSSEYVCYIMREIKDAKKRVRGNALEFEYTILIGSDVSKDLLCHMIITWNLESPIKVKYECSTEDISAESADGSGEVSGSYEYFYENNF